MCDYCGSERYLAGVRHTTTLDGAISAYQMGLDRHDVAKGEIRNWRLAIQDSVEVSIVYEKSSRAEQTGSIANDKAADD